MCVCVCCVLEERGLGGCWAARCSKCDRYNRLLAWRRNDSCIITVEARLTNGSYRDQCRMKRPHVCMAATCSGRWNFGSKTQRSKTQTEYFSDFIGAFVMDGGEVSGVSLPSSRLWVLDSHLRRGAPTHPHRRTYRHSIPCLGSHVYLHDTSWEVPYHAMNL